LKDDSDGCVLLCNLSEPEVEEASLADCDEPTESNNALSLDAAPHSETVDGKCCTVDSESTSTNSDCVTSPQAPVTAAVLALPVNRKKRFARQGAGVTSRKKQKRQ